MSSQLHATLSPSRRRTRRERLQPRLAVRRSTTTFTRTSLVLIISTLMPASAEGLEHADADAGVAAHADAGDRSLATVGSLRHRAAAELVGDALRAPSTALSTDSRGTVKLRFASPSRPTLCTIMSTRMPSAATASKIAAAMPGLIGHVRNASRGPASRSSERRRSSGLPSAAAATTTSTALASDPLAAAPSPKLLRELGRLLQFELVVHGPQRCHALRRARRGTEILISLVVIIWMLTFASASARNMRSATPVCVAMPRPTTETFDTLASCVHLRRRARRPLPRRLRARRQVVFEHGEGDVGLRRRRRRSARSCRRRC